MPSEPRHRLIYRELLSEIAAGKYRDSGRLPSETQLVERFGVSRPTVARALHDLQEQGLVDRRIGSGTYVRANKRPAADGAARELGLLIPGLGRTEIFEVICGEIASLARVGEYMLLWGGSGHPRASLEASVQEAENLLEQYLERRVAGVFFAPFEHRSDQDQVNRQITERLHQAGVAVVLLDRDLAPFPQRSRFDLISIDNFAGGFLLAEHLLKLKCRRLLFVARPRSAATVDARIAGAREAALAYGFALPKNFVRIGEPTEASFVQRLLAKPWPDAIVCANDHTAATLIRTLQKRGVRVPQDVRVVGFDDVKYATLLSPPLTTIHQPCRDIAEVAFRTMLDRIAEPTLPGRTLIVAPQLVVRESCGAYLR